MISANMGREVSTLDEDQDVVSTYTLRGTVASKDSLMFTERLQTWYVASLFMNLTEYVGAGKDSYMMYFQ